MIPIESVIGADMGRRQTIEEMGGERLRVAAFSSSFGGHHHQSIEEFEGSEFSIPLFL
jgi:hypothetical protein